MAGLLSRKRRSYYTGFQNLETFEHLPHRKGVTIETSKPHVDICIKCFNFDRFEYLRILDFL